MRAPALFLLLAIAGLLLLLWFYRSDAPTAKQPPPEASAQIKVAGVPAKTVQAYKRAAEREGVSWRLLLAIGKAESDHGRSPLPGVSSGINSADCCAGPMQLCVRDFCGNVASLYARDGDRDGQYSVYDIEDASATAAAYLRWMEGLLGRNPLLLAAGYNAGPTIVRKEGIPPYPETRAYVRQVQKTLRSIS